MDKAKPVLFLMVLLVLAVILPPDAVTQDLGSKAPPPPPKEAKVVEKKIPDPPGAPLRLSLAQDENNDPGVDVQRGRKVKLTWEPPRDSAPIHHYLVERAEIGPTFPDTLLINDIPDTFVEFYVEHGKPTSVRVAAVDTFHQVGVFSESIPVYGPRVRK